MIILVSDHAGFELKNIIIESMVLDVYDSDLIDLNPEYDADDDYPDIAESVTYVDNYENAKIIAICGSGQGMCMALNKLPGIRAGFGVDEYAAKMMRIDNNANAICFSQRNQKPDEVLKLIEVFLSSDFSEEKRHHRRVEKLDKLSELSD